MLVACFPVSAFAGLEVTYNVQTKVGSNATDMDMHYMMQGNWVRVEFETPSPTGREKIVHIRDLKTKKSITLFPSKKTYLEMSAEDFERIKGAMGAFRIVKPVETSKPVRAQDFKKTGESKKIAGHSCDVMEHKAKDQTQRVCVNEDLGDEYRKYFIGFAESYGEHISIPKDVQGFPLELHIVSTAGNAAGGPQPGESKMLVKRIKSANVPNNMFEVPSGYERMNTEIPPEAMKALEEMKDGKMSDEMKAQLEKAKKLMEEMQKKHGGGK